MKKTLLFGLSLLLMASCKKEQKYEMPYSNSSLADSLEDPYHLSESEKRSLVLLGNMQVPESETKAAALELLAELGRDEKHEIGKESIRIIQSPIELHLEGLSYPVAYIYNFLGANGEEQGYAIVSGDRRLPLELAFVPKGRISKTINEPGQSVCMAQLQSMIQYEIANFNEEYTPHLETALKKLNVSNAGSRNTGLFPTITYGPWTTVVTKAPLVSVEWNQGSPYNDHVSLKCGTDQAPTGCVATAVAQICTNYNRPLKYNGHTYHWAELEKVANAKNLSSTYRSEIATLFSDIGKGVGMEYGCDGSTASMDNARNLLGSFGYHTDKDDYNFSYVKADRDQNRVLMITGYAIKKVTSVIFDFVSYDEGHAWVIDGYKKRTRTANVTIGSITYPGLDTQDLVHCNFGWGGSSNGYYVSGIFDTTTKPVARVSSGKSGYYQYELKLLHNLYLN